MQCALASTSHYYKEQNITVTQFIYIETLFNAIYYPNYFILNHVEIKLIYRYTYRYGPSRKARRQESG